MNGVEKCQEVLGNTIHGLQEENKRLDFHNHYLRQYLTRHTRLVKKMFPLVPKDSTLYLEIESNLKEFEEDDGKLFYKLSEAPL